MLKQKPESAIVSQAAKIVNKYQQKNMSSSIRPLASVLISWFVSLLLLVIPFPMIF